MAALRDRTEVAPASRRHPRGTRTVVASTRQAQPTCPQAMMARRSGVTPSPIAICRPNKPTAITQTAAPTAAEATRRALKVGLEGRQKILCRRTIVAATMPRITPAPLKADASVSCLS
ncbi:hypothetical protein EMIHUDRAFT_454702 [Emiliania huxleyi CCMP1516]|uniref:Uncharacterized protein n=2 Tax=Emiliania huxleyi TaxID=2903 RepID=A0A0D3KRE4_EMIH1|nr:hypothetical protein EMIHUDRAFT_454702 [Emiliania huxleyi CCMP1516]EOD38329.1 hypothetical protein EMIHUDRAFT_454702 [Emiliania huxleyi CCMP1516]|eukprot:XP_005790758.1 hypothetical protein EMIHUDRAFT_454702 [Emiliania huxleyi CCMP1516]